MRRTECDTKQKLIDTALDLIWKSSFGAVSVDDICKTADVRKGSFYHFFPSKIDLVIAAMDETAKTMRPSYDDVFSASRNPVERFERYADMMIAKQEEAKAEYGHVCGCPLASLGSELAGQDCGIREKFEEIHNSQARHFETALRDMIAEGQLPEGTDVKVKAQELLAFATGQMIMARIQNDLGLMKRDFKTGLLQLLGVNAKAPQAA